MIDILSIGDAQLLIAVLQGVALLTATSGPAGYGGLIALGLLLGLLITVARAIVTQRLELQWVLVGWLLYAVLFGPKISVSVEDIYTGNTTVVANVPIGVAAIGGITSQIGVTLTDAFGTVFSAPSMTSGGYMDALDIIHSIRALDFGDANDGTPGTHLKAVDLQRSLRAYLKDCAFYDLWMELPAHDVTWESLRTANDRWAALQVNSNSWFTTLYLVGGDEDGQTVTCTAAYRNLADFITNNFYPAWEEYVGSVLGLDPANPEGDVQDALDALFGTGKNAQTFMLNALIDKEITLAELGYHASVNNTAGVVMRTQAMEQRRVQWATEQSMFQEVARPLIAYVEAFFYAVSPFMAFLFTLGGFGISLVAKYLLLAVWIQLWMPMMAINNLYVTMAASQRLQAIDAAGTDVLSMIGMENVWTETASWLAVGGTMAAATPLLALMLITGSYYTLMRLTDRMSGADFVNEKVAAPDILAPAPAVQAGAIGYAKSDNTRDPVRGWHLTDAERVVPSINLGSALGHSVASARTDQQQAVADWAKGMGASFDWTRTGNLETFVQTHTSSGLRSTHTEVDSVMDRYSTSIVEGTSLENGTTLEQKAILHGALGAALSSPGRSFGPQGSVNQILQSIRGISETERSHIQTQIQNVAASEDGIRTELSEAIARNAENGEVSRYAHAMGVKDSEDWRQVQRDVASASRTYNELSSLRGQAGWDFKVNALDFGAVVQDQGALNQLRSMAAGHGVNGNEIAEQKGRFIHLGLLPDNQEGREKAEAAAIGLSISQSGNAAAISELTHFMTPLFGSGVIRPGDPSENGAMEGSGQEYGKARDWIDSDDRAFQGVRDPIDEKVAGAVDLNGSSWDEIIAAGSGAVQEFFNAHQQGNQARMHEAIADIERLATLAQVETIENTFTQDRGLGQWLNETDFTELARHRFEVTGKGLGSAAGALATGAVGEEYDRLREEGQGPMSAALGSTAAILRGYQDGVRGHIDETYDDAIEQARRYELPDVGQAYYAQSVLSRTNTQLGVSRGWGLDESYNALGKSVEELGGEAARISIERAAASDGPIQNQYLRQAETLFKARNYE